MAGWLAAHPGGPPVLQFAVPHDARQGPPTVARRAADDEGVGRGDPTNLPLRNDGQPRSDVARFRIGGPGVAVYFLLRKRRMVMARDFYENVHDNLRSIGHAIAHLRGLERHGGASMMERAFEGFAALPPPDQPQRRPWRVVLGLEEMTGPAFAMLAAAEASWKHLARSAHPDAGGSDDAMSALNAAIADARKELGNV